MATNFLDLLRRDPDYQAKVLAGPHQELIRLLWLVDGCEIFIGDDDNLRIRAGEQQAMLLDELAA